MSAWIAMCGPAICAAVESVGRADERVTEHYRVPRVDATAAPGGHVAPASYDGELRSGYSHTEYTAATASTFGTTWPARRRRHLKGSEPFRKFFK